MIPKLFEGFGVRALPGLINLGVLLLLSEWLSVPAFGLYSTGIAVAGFVASMTFGPLAFSVVAHHARHDVAGLGGRYEAGLFTTALALACALLGVAGMAAMVDLVSWTYAAPAAALGFYTVVLEFPRARLKYWHYGTASLFQSIAFLAAAAVFVREAGNPHAALQAFTLSYALAAVISLGFSGWPRLTKPDLDLLIPSLRTGGGYTLSIAVENGLYLGMRFVVMAIGSPHLLGVFSFSIDLAQRVVGIFANIASFVVVPMAFKNDFADNEQFERTLYAGGAVAFLMCSAALVGIHAAHASGLVPILDTPVFEPLTFTIVSAAVVINRLKKLVIDPFVLRAGRASALATGFVFGTPVAIGTAIAFQWLGPLVPPLAMVFGYLVAAVSTLVALRYCGSATEAGTISDRRSRNH